MKSWWDGSVVAGIHHWLDCFQGKAQPGYGPGAARDALEVILCAYEAAKTGRTLAIG
jgi:predicted dehydrogenase